jgi:hypothetical protein
MFDFLFGKSKTKENFSIQKSIGARIVTQQNGKSGGFVKSPAGWVGHGANAGQQFIRSGIKDGWKLK